MVTGIVLADDGQFPEESWRKSKCSTVLQMTLACVTRMLSGQCKMTSRMPAAKIRPVQSASMVSENKHVKSLTYAMGCTQVSLTMPCPH